MNPNPMLAALCLASTAAFSAGTLETPQMSSNQSGVGIVSGWYCDASVIEIAFDDRLPLVASYGTTRNDTETTCGDSNNGFGLLWNYSLLGEGVHRVRAYADGVEFTDNTFTVGTIGSEPYVTGLAGTYQLEDFPTEGEVTSIQWTESVQGFTVNGTASTLTPLRKWQLTTETPTDSDPIVTARLSAEDLSSIFTNTTPELVVACSGNNYDITIQWNDVTSADDPFANLSLHREQS